MDVDSITCQNFEHANQVLCENNPQFVTALNPDTENFILKVYERNQFQNNFSRDAFTAQVAGIF